MRFCGILLGFSLGLVAVGYFISPKVFVDLDKSVVCVIWVLWMEWCLEDFISLAWEGSLISRMGIRRVILDCFGI